MMRSVSSGEMEMEMEMKREMDMDMDMDGPPDHSKINQRRPQFIEDMIEYMFTALSGPGGGVSSSFYPLASQHPLSRLRVT